MTSQNLHPPHTHTHNAVYNLQTSSRWRPDHNSQAQIYQHCATIYTNLHGGTTDASQPTHFLILLKKIQKFFGPFSGAPGAHAHHFRIPLLSLHNLKFSRRFDLNSRFLLHGTSFHLLLGLVNIFFRSKVQNSPY